MIGDDYFRIENEVDKEIRRLSEIIVEERKHKL
jgi:hypothetical protein